jgi:mRNA-degrading endonuclease toxin of MazEF toxin-antitoxin module
MVDKIMQIEKSRVQKVVGHLTKKQMDEIESRLLAILGVH